MLLPPKVRGCIGPPLTGQTQMHSPVRHLQICIRSMCEPENPEQMECGAHLLLSLLFLFPPTKRPGAGWRGSQQQHVAHRWWKGSGLQCLFRYNS